MNTECKSFIMKSIPGILTVKLTTVSWTSSISCLYLAHSSSTYVTRYTYTSLDDILLWELSRHIAYGPETQTFTTRDQFKRPSRLSDNLNVCSALILRQHRYRNNLNWRTTSMKRQPYFRNNLKRKSSSIKRNFHYDYR